MSSAEETAKKQNAKKSGLTIAVTSHGISQVRENGALFGEFASMLSVEENLSSQLTPEQRRILLLEDPQDAAGSEPQRDPAAVEPAQEPPTAAQSMSANGAA